MNFSVLVMSCDKNKKLLDCFFTYFKRFFVGYTGEIYVALEKNDYEFEGLNICVLKSEKSSWSDRFIDAIKKIDHKSILLFLDDFIIEGPVDILELEKVGTAIVNDDTIGHFALTTVPMKNLSEELCFAKYYRRAQYGRYKTTLQCGMWNRSELLDILVPNESPWEIEIFGNIRSYISRRKYYAVAKREWKPIDYNDGFFCLQGKQNLEEIQRLEEKFGESFRIEGMKDNGGIIVRDDISLLYRIIRRVKIIFLSCFYRIKSMMAYLF